MPAKPSGEIKTNIVPVPQKNGDIYLMERKTQYDPVKKYNRVISSKLVSKIPKGEKILCLPDQKLLKDIDPAFSET